MLIRVVIIIFVTINIVTPGRLHSLSAVLIVYIVISVFVIVMVAVELLLQYLLTLELCKLHPLASFLYGGVDMWRALCTGRG